MFAIGNDELSGVTVKKGDVVINKQTKEEAAVELPKDADTGKESDRMQFVTLKDGKSYIVGIAGNLLTDRWEIKNDNNTM